VSDDVGIKSYAAYIPRLRMNREAIAAAHSWALPALKGLSKGERAFANWDEDSITMGVEATRPCLSSEPDGSVHSLIFASTTAPFADFQNATMVAAASGLPPDTATLDVGGSLRAGTSALISSLQSKATADTVVVAADSRLARPGSAQEMQYGAGSFALRIGSGRPIARLVGSAAVASPFADHFRAAGEKFDYHWEERWVREEGYLKIVPETIARLLRDTGVRAETVGHFCLPGNIAGIGAAVARQMRITPEAVVANLAGRCGDTGTPQPLLMLGAALERAAPGEKILVVGFGGGCDALLLETTEALKGYRSVASLSAAVARGITDNHYTKLLSFSEELDMDWGMRSESDSKTALTQFYRAADQVAGFVGGKCTRCGAVQYPRLPACVNCGEVAGQTPCPLADEPARVATFTADWLMFYPAPPLYVGLVQFDNGARLLMEMVEVDPTSFDVGTPLRMVYRIKEKDNRRHFNRYFWKAAPRI
jgi:3-hydroxy-3-methylglutaryl CoA synthase